MPLNYRVSYAFIRLSDAALDDFASTVVVSLTGNPAFTDPLVPLAAITTKRTEFHDAVVAAEGGGAMLKAAKNEKREALLTLLRKEASYVQAMAGQNLSVLLSSGFQANSTNHASAPFAHARDHQPRQWCEHNVGG